jgi:apoptosis-inducing factor 3
MTTPALPNFSNGFPVDDISDGGMVLGTVDGEEVILARRGNEFFAVGATCTHYGGPLAQGLIVGTELRCPLHHACFRLKTGEVLRPPAFDPIPHWRVERTGDKVFVREKLPAIVSKPGLTSASKHPASVVIVGGGAAGVVAADTLRRESYQGPVTIISADDSPPYDRPNVSKDYLAGEAPEDWLPLRPPTYYSDQHIDLVLKSRVSAIDVRESRVGTEDGKWYDYGALLLATGAEPASLAINGASKSQVHCLRSLGG